MKRFRKAIPKVAREVFTVAPPKCVGIRLGHSVPRQGRKRPDRGRIRAEQSLERSLACLLAVYPPRTGHRRAEFSGMEAHRWTTRADDKGNYVVTSIGGYITLNPRRKNIFRLFPKELPCTYKDR